MYSPFRCTVLYKRTPPPPRVMSSPADNQRCSNCIFASCEINHDGINHPLAKDEFTKKNKTENYTALLATFSLNCERMRKKSIKRMCIRTDITLDDWIRTGMRDETNAWKMTLDAMFAWEGLVRMKPVEASTRQSFSVLFRFCRSATDKDGKRRNGNGTLRGKDRDGSNAQQTGPRLAAVGGWLVSPPFSDPTKASTSGFRRQA